MYEFQKQDAFDFAHFIHANAKERGDELVFSKCPFCQQATVKNSDKEKFSINLTTGQYHCFRASCGASGNMITLSKQFNFPLPGYADEYVNHRKQFVKFRAKESMKPTTTDSAIEYLKGRGVSEEVAKLYNIGVKPDNDKVLVIPFYDENDELQLIKYRDTTATKENGRSKEWSFKSGDLSCKPILFGMNHCDPEVSDTLIMTEGQMDTLAAVTAGAKNVVSVPTGANGFTWVPYCWDFLRRFKTLIVFGDCEKGKITLLEDMQRYFKGVVKAVKQEDYLGEKDANDILRKHGAEAVLNAIQNAETVPAKGIVKMKDIKRVEVGDLQKIDTGIRQLNQLIGGFYFGQLIILSGSTGSGKSTLASQFAVFAVASGIKTFFYSGELQNWQLRNWFEFQAAGKQNIADDRTRAGFESYRLKTDVAERLEKWYGDLVELYDNTELEEEQSENQSVSEIINKAIQQGNQMLIIDNLMTAMDEYNGDDFYKQQTNFIRRLSVTAKRNNVTIILVAHFKKGNGFEPNIDSVSGSSNIVNLADTVLSFRQPSEKDSHCSRVLDVLKNRITGRTGDIKLWYEEKSRRLSENQEIFDFNVLGDFTDIEDGEIDAADIFATE